MTTGGVPTVYAGDEFGFTGRKEERAGGDDAVRPEFSSPPLIVDDNGAAMFALHQYLIGLRRRHPWLHTARTTALQLDNEHYIYETRQDEEALIVALNLDDAALRMYLSEFGLGSARIVAGSGAPAEAVVESLDVEPHGWAVLAV